VRGADPIRPDGGGDPRRDGERRGAGVPVELGPQGTQPGIEVVCERGRRLGVRLGLINEYQRAA
jgi:hypothetical protein